MKWGMSLERHISACPEQVWELMGSFCGLKRWNIPTLEVCEQVEGEEGVPGCVRYLAGGGTRADGSPERWVKEKLLSWHGEKRQFSYTIVESSYGLQGYVANIAIREDVRDGGAVAEWSFEVNPVHHLSQDDLFRFLHSMFERMMLSLENTLTAAIA